MEGLHYFLSKYPTPPPTSLIICCDNKTTIKTLNTGNPTNQEIPRRTLQLAEEITSKGTAVKTLWTPAHRGIIGNNSVDRAAKEASTHLPICTHAFISREYLLQQAKNKLLKDWQHTLEKAGIQHPLQPSMKVPPQLKLLPFRHTKALFRTQLQVTPSDGYPSEPTPPCSCNPNGPPTATTASHLVWECPRFTSHRQKFLANMTTFDDIYHPSHTSDVISFLSSTGIGFISFV
jgi:hypothetical protein